MRRLERLTASGADVVPLLRAALAGDGPALLARPVDAPVAVGDPPPPAEVERRVALVVETSGTTSRPKRVALSSDALLASAAASQAALGAPGQWILALPTHYIAGLQVLVRSIAAGAAPAVLGAGSFDPRAFAELAASLDARVARYTSLVPTQLHRLVEAAEGDPGDAARRVRDAVRRLDAILVGGQATPPHLVDRAAALGWRVVRTYGSSETAGGCVYDGVPVATAEVAVVDGQVELAGPMLAEGYLGDPAATDAAFGEHDGRRWYRTGDGGDLVDGVLRITGRLDDVVISGGEKLRLTAVEEAVRSMVAWAPRLGEAVAVPGEHPGWGQRPVVFAPGTVDPELAERVRRELAARLGRVAGSAVVRGIDALPTLPSGKPDRRALRARADADPRG
ncbi:AMP-binding protein [Clavibacter michiganensis]|uniref:O-succinylbenzoate--CoA ligase n=4 Tax=Clavibacter michiganensis TaxID=28447 RepID=A0A0D5CG05_9MICO|nr:AMP-binding protein [Clavibacter michiganensis]AJW78167.1 O-succinylbenzoate--CoA ligase [Clavibacter michiganensis subsp. insidiosus]AWF99433.1 o-succinylbenzoate--CoA ligase [Clavibacter michiganensis subsp. insidiosus]AWG00449.1 o-succinylbenzoate--CoA ligase [Clavibacter michiganensis subsp. insidiosus]OQJ60928.1 o-succinylbenzoate--CoA ligase [Clavibacter michiganensis subsp. insidiosus]RMC83824.1 o-succinylbenzoate--CoA ligase [Clavibacter michiganensis subsp. insidiosus]